MWAKHSLSAVSRTSLSTACVVLGHYQSSFIRTNIIFQQASTTAILIHVHKGCCHGIDQGLGGGGGGVGGVSILSISRHIGVSTAAASYFECGNAVTQEPLQPMRCSG